MGKKTRLDVYNDFPASAIDTVIAEWIHNERDRRILHMKLIDGYSYERISEIEGMSTKGVQNIVHDAEDRLYQNLIIIYHR